MKFSDADPKQFSITPLGAAIVEALPDRKQVARIRAEFKRNGTVPTSRIFPTQDAIAAYSRSEINRFGRR